MSTNKRKDHKKADAFNNKQFIKTIVVTLTELESNIICKIINNAFMIPFSYNQIVSYRSTNKN